MCPIMQLTLAKQLIFSKSVFALFAKEALLALLVRTVTDRRLERLKEMNVCFFTLIQEQLEQATIILPLMGML